MLIIADIKKQNKKQLDHLLEHTRALPVLQHLPVTF